MFTNNIILGTGHVSITHFCTEKPTFVLSFIYMFDIIWPPAPFTSCYLARSLKEVARACTRVMGLYRGNTIAIEREASDSLTYYHRIDQSGFACKERNLHCDVHGAVEKQTHIAVAWVARLVMGHAIAAIQTSR